MSRSRCQRAGEGVSAFHCNSDIQDVMFPRLWVCKWASCGYWKSRQSVASVRSRGCRPMGCRVISARLHTGDKLKESPNRRSLGHRERPEPLLMFSGKWAGSVLEGWTMFLQHSFPPIQRFNACVGNIVLKSPEGFDRVEKFGIWRRHKIWLMSFCYSSVRSRIEATSS